MNSLVVGGLLKRIYPTFNLSTFSNRLRLQKTIYLLQQSGINLGYSFSYYLYGPYSSDLTRTSFNLPDFKDIKEVGFEDPAVEKKFEEFKEKIEPHKNDDFWLEVATSIHALKKIYLKSTKNQIIKKIEDKRPEFNLKRKQIEKVWGDIERWLL